jgi:hypothetical protein
VSLVVFLLLMGDSFLARDALILLGTRVELAES